MTQKLPSLKAMIEEVEYELDQRRRVYANLNARKPQATREAAEREIHMQRMQGVLELLKLLRDKEAPTARAIIAPDGTIFQL